MSDNILGWEQRGFRAWPAPRNVYFGGWVFRLGEGFSKRANSANALGDAETPADPTAKRPFAEVISEAERVYEANGLPAIFRLTPLAGAEADTLLSTRGYALFEPSRVMTAALERAGEELRVRVETRVTPDWLDGVTAAREVAPSHRAVHDRIVQAITPRTGFATAYVGATAAGFGLGVLDRAAVGLFDIVVRPEFRGRGLGRAITRALMAWGRDLGADAAYLQVNDANGIAIGLYESLGFRAAYAYHYRRRPE